MKISITTLGIKVGQGKAQHWEILRPDDRKKKTNAHVSKMLAKGFQKLNSEYSTKYMDPKILRAGANSLGLNRREGRERRGRWQRRQVLNGCRKTTVLKLQTPDENLLEIQIPRHCLRPSESGTLRWDPAICVLTSHQVILAHAKV